MELVPLTKLDESKTIMSKIFDDDVMPANCDVIVFFPIYGQVKAIGKLDSGQIVYKISISIHSVF